jgi:hypothetical protein
MVNRPSRSVAVTAVAIVVALLATSVVSSTMVQPAYAAQKGSWCYNIGTEGASTCAETKKQCEQSRDRAIALGQDVTSKCYRDKEFELPPI